jgi:hypothetical protein
MVRPWVETGEAEGFREQPVKRRQKEKEDNNAAQERRCMTGPYDRWLGKLKVEVTYSMVRLRGWEGV